MDELWLTYAVSVSLLAFLILLPIAAPSLPATGSLAAVLVIPAAAVLLQARALERSGLLSKGFGWSDLEYLAGVDLIRALVVAWVGSGWFLRALRILDTGAVTGVVFLLMSAAWALGLATAETWRRRGWDRRALSLAILSADMLLWFAGLLSLGEVSWMGAALLLLTSVGLGPAILAECLGVALSSRRSGGGLTRLGALLYLLPAILGSSLLVVEPGGVAQAAARIHCLVVLLGSPALCRRVGPLATWAYAALFPVNPLILHGISMKLSLLSP